MYDFKRHLLALKRGGVSKFLRKNLMLMHREGGYLLFHFDSDADYYPGRAYNAGFKKTPRQAARRYEYAKKIHYYYTAIKASKRTSSKDQKIAMN